MGGATSEVSEGTRRVLLEVAHFQPQGVRRSAKRHGLHTEASHRFERGCDIEAVPEVLDRAAGLLAELCGGTVRPGRLDVFPKPPARRQVTLRHGRVAEVLGVELPKERSREILVALGFTPAQESAAQTSYGVPARRVDVEREEDLIEELARIAGYEAIPAVLPQGGTPLRPESPEAELERRVHLALRANGFDQVVNYSFVAPKELEALGVWEGTVTLLNPLSVEQSVMRTTLFAGLLQNVSRNQRQQVDRGRLYELGRAYVAPPTTPSRKDTPVALERPLVSGVLFGPRAPKGWTAKDAPVDFFDAKGALQALLEALGVTTATFRPLDGAPYHPRAAAVVEAGGHRLGTLGEVHPKVAKAFDVSGAVFLFELEVEALVKAAVLVPQAKPLPRFPAVLRDVAVVVPAEVPQAQVRALILEVGGALLEDAVLFDVYAGKPIPEGKRSLAYALSFRAGDRTLTDAEAQAAHQRIVDEVDRRLGGQLRT
jgi:phenylalanyl-tRNA synthetase beta chain